MLVCLPSLCLNAVRAIFSSLLYLSNRWKEDPPEFSNAVKVLLKGRSIMKRNILHHLEAGRIMEIAGNRIKVLGMSNYRVTIFQHQKK